MEPNTLPSTLGFGLSSLAGSGNFAHQERLIRTAIDEGVTHFDVAPYYGSGDAEALLGKILSPVSEPVTIATKYGLQPVGGGRLAALARQSLRPVFRQFGGLKRLASRLVNRVRQPETEVQVTGLGGDLTRSLERSMELIGRPIDLYLLHDASYAFASREEVREELDAARQAGHISASGISGASADVQAAIRAFPATYRVAQLENSLTQPAPLTELSAPDGLVTYRAISSGLGHLKEHLRQPRFRNRWREGVLDETEDESVLARVLLELAIYENRGGTVLFSTRQPDRVRQLARAVHDPLLDQQQLRELTTLLGRAAHSDKSTPRAH
jgi:aryl-alcohol dehydrogenase-like predicted oxidoreductase